jgi:hypothetical protein
MVTVTGFIVKQPVVVLVPFIKYFPEAATAPGVVNEVVAVVSVQ